MANVYNVAKKRLADGDLDLNLPADLRMLLLQSSGPPVFNADHATITAVLGDAANTEVSVGGYSRQALTGEITAQDDTNDRMEASANKVTFAALAAGQTIGAAVLYDEGGGTDGTRYPIAYYELTDTATNGGDQEVRFSGVDGVGVYLRLT